ncbi:hypothetical protein AcW1_004965 [Taiwanofungus camphoratus]|nr:hypothetical protein AcW2_006027 [Antrodia cinnamomea]KAI0941284.1 hypothetical protein AcV7_002898 [Antrodia cinnamomea]KAI0960459.1 hypothetical protein AcW1_004965 [Antrodia cinnamomea]
MMMIFVRGTSALRLSDARSFYMSESSYVEKHVINIPRPIPILRQHQLEGSDVLCPICLNTTLHSSISADPDTFDCSSNIMHLVTSLWYCITSMTSKLMHCDIGGYKGSS